MGANLSNRSGYLFTKDGAGFTLKDNRSNYGIDIVTTVERIKTFVLESSNLTKCAPPQRSNLYRRAPSLCPRGGRPT